MSKPDKCRYCKEHQLHTQHVCDDCTEYENPHIRGWWAYPPYQPYYAAWLRSFGHSDKEAFWNEVGHNCDFIEFMNKQWTQLCKLYNLHKNQNRLIPECDKRMTEYLNEKFPKI